MNCGINGAGSSVTKIAFLDVDRISVAHPHLILRPARRIAQYSVKNLRRRRQAKQLVISGGRVYCPETAPCPAIYFANFFARVDSVSTFRRAKNFLLFAAPACNKRACHELIRRPPRKPAPAGKPYASHRQSSRKSRPRGRRQSRSHVPSRAA